MADNKRLEYRLPVEIMIDRLIIPGQGVEAHKGFILELSASGCRLESSFLLDVGQAITLHFKLAGGHTMAPVHGRVIRRMAQNQKKIVAVEFVGLAEEDQYKIREFVIWKEFQR